ncbi:hypothetical protein B0H14DRAFT_3479036 [Mycena olivaceomarginata]|nr:hypothetical protein B0H14DRAFT_3479036 [Mycena olivaceomarginata]
MPSLRRTASPDEITEPTRFSRSSTIREYRQIGDLLGGAARLILEVSQPFPGDDVVPKDDERRRASRFDVIRVSTGTYVVRDEFFDRMAILPLGYLMVSTFSLASWYANIQAEELGIEGFEFLRTHQVRVQELLESEVQRYLAEKIGTRVFATGGQTQLGPSSIQTRQSPSPPAPHCRSLTLAARGASGFAPSPNLEIPSDPFNDGNRDSRRQPLAMLQKASHTARNLYGVHS